MKLGKQIAPLIIACLFTLPVHAQEVFPLDIERAAKLLVEQNCGECDHDLPAQLQAIAELDAYAAKQRQPALAVLLLRAKSSYSLAAVHYRQPPEWKKAQLDKARNLMHELFAKHPRSLAVAEQYTYIMPEEDPHKLRAYQVVAKAKPHDADAHFDLGFFNMYASGLGSKAKWYPRQLQRGVELQTWPGRLENYFSKIYEQVKIQQCKAEPQFALLETELRQAMQGVDRDSEALTPALSRFKRRFIAQIRQLGCGERNISNWQQ